jgi:beta-N-acetylhexosaminidase
MEKSQIGQLFILGFRGKSLPRWLLDFEQEFGLGGVILFDYDFQRKNYDNNVESSAQLKQLCRAIASLESKPLVFIDQEGGKVRRLKDTRGFQPLPSQWEMAALPEAEMRMILEASYREMKSVGIDINLAPVIDLNLNPENPDIGKIGRSFSADPEVVKKNVSIVNEVAREVGLGLCLKHYPGLGGATVNSHLELTDLSDSISETQLDLFYACGKMIHGQSILISHGRVEQWDAANPVSMSGVAVKKLRTRLPEALLMSDDIQMQGLQKIYSTAEACERGIAAGLDLILIGNNLLAEELNCRAFATALFAAVEKSETMKISAGLSLARVEARKHSFRS